MGYKPPKSVTVTFPYEQFSEVCDTLQMIAVVGADLAMNGVVLRVSGQQPDKKKLLAAFDTMARAEMPPPREDDHK